VGGAKALTACCVNAVAAPCPPDRVVPLLREPHGFAGCRECRYQVEPATASLRAAEGGTVPIPPKWREDTAPVSLFQWVDAARLFSLREPPCRHGDDRNRGALAAGVDMP
jgi:hypothetical protein